MKKVFLIVWVILFMTLSCSPLPSPSNPPSCNSSFDPSSIKSGESTNFLVDYSNDADGQIPYSCDGNIGSGTFNSNPGTGSTSNVFYPTQTQTCTLTVQNIANETSTCVSNVTVTINPPLPDVQFTEIPNYGNSSDLKGKVIGVNYSEYKIMVYIKVEGIWWTKPFYNSPLISINQSGTWTADITTGGYDQYATEIIAFLVPANITPTICGPCCELPNISQSVDFAYFDRTPTPNTIFFADQTWLVKNMPFPAGPGPNFFSDSSNNVWIDTNGLHLKIRYENNKWQCSEVILNKSYGYGTYIFVTNSRLDILDPNVVLGMFTWDPKGCNVYFREIDIEYARWQNPNEYTNGQFVTQPCNQCPGCDNCTRFKVDLDDLNKYLTNYIVWGPEKIEFRVYYGKYVDAIPPANALAAKWEFTGTSVPTPGEENVRINLWLVGGNSPYYDQETEVNITDFKWQEQTPIWNDEPPPPPDIQFTYIPPLGSFDNLNGQVMGVNPADYKVAVYIRVGSGWWTKPYWNNPLTTINSDGTWVCDITTGGIDQTANTIIAFLVPNGYSPPSMSGQMTLPDELYTNAIDFVETTR